MKQEGRLLIVDDNEEILLSLQIFLEKYFEEIICLNNPESIRNELSQKDFDVVLLDMNFTASIQSGNEGMFWMNEILKIDPQISIIFITAFPGLELAVKAIKEGAFDFIEKPWNKEKLLTTVINAVKLRRSKKQVSLLKERQSAKNESPSLIKGNSPQMKRVHEAVDKVSVTDASVLILGENGTGKEVMARYIHSRSNRAGESFAKVDVGSLPESLFESEMFGYVKGAFTDAKQAKAGKIELANQGTLFLDEIGNLSLNLQAKLLRVLQEKKVSRLGANKLIEVDFRLICATNQNLEEMIARGAFREDLFYRINTVKIDLPPLRERTADILNFANHFLKIHALKYNKSELSFEEDLRQFINQFNWPGNVRQLDHAIENAVIMCDGDVMRLKDFSLYETSGFETRSADQLNFYSNEKDLVISALKESKGNLSKAAHILGVARTTLYRKMKKYDL